MRRRRPGLTAADATTTQKTPAWRDAWWWPARDALLEAAARGTPRYVYDATTLDERAGALRRLAGVDRALYALKANSHPGVLARLARAGLGFECVSIGEVARAEACRAATATRGAPFVFTPNFAPRAEYEAAVALGATLTLDALHPIMAWPTLLAGREVFLRVDVGLAAGHHRHVRTGGEASKFGLDPSDVRTAARALAAAGAELVGLHAHAGSGIFEPGTWGALARALASVAADLPDVRVLDLGGGLGVPARPGGRALDLDLLDANLLAFRAANPRFEVWLEPGRFAVAEAGVLLTRVTQVKVKGGRTFVGVDAGMHTLLRPALYGARHPIVHLTRPLERPHARVDVVGPICEAGDVLARGALLPTCAEGDVLLIGVAGAYGATMASTYNLRPLPEEELLER